MTKIITTMITLFLFAGVSHGGQNPHNLKGKAKTYWDLSQECNALENQFGQLLNQAGKLIESHNCPECRQVLNSWHTQVQTAKTSANSKIMQSNRAANPQDAGISAYRSINTQYKNLQRTISSGIDVNKKSICGKCTNGVIQTQKAKSRMADMSKVARSIGLDPALLSKAELDKLSECHRLLDMTLYSMNVEDEVNFLGFLKDLYHTNKGIQDYEKVADNLAAMYEIYKNPNTPPVKKWMEVLFTWELIPDEPFVRNALNDAIQTSTVSGFEEELRQKSKEIEDPRDREIFLREFGLVP